MQRTIILALLLACGTALASEWVPVAKNSQLEVFVDVSSIRIAGEIRRAWLKMVMQPHSERGIGADANKWVAYKQSREAIHCLNETHYGEALTEYFSDGSNHTVSQKPDIAWEPVPPDTVFEAVMHFVCAWKPT
jgi:hypothetical protein